MSRSTKGGRRPVVYWAICPECLTYIWVNESQISGEETASCPYCEIPISLLGGRDLSDSLRELQSLLEDVERQIAVMPAAVDVHRFLFEQVEFIAGAFNDRLDEIQANKDVSNLDTADLEAKQAS